MPQVEIPDWMISDDEGGEDEMDGNEANGIVTLKTLKEEVEVDVTKLENLLKRRKVYGDITQNATESQIKRLLVSTHAL